MQSRKSLMQAGRIEEGVEAHLPCSPFFRESDVWLRTMQNIYPINKNTGNTLQNGRKLEESECKKWIWLFFQYTPQ